MGGCLIPLCTTAAIVAIVKEFDMHVHICTVDPMGVVASVTDPFSSSESLGARLLTQVQRKYSL